MKKFLLPFLGFTIIASASSSVVSCRAAAYTQGDIGERIVFITDAGPINDKSFNESIYKTVVQYSDKKKTNVEGGFGFATRKLSAKRNYIQPLKTEYSDLISAYKLANLKGIDILVISGFQHEMGIPKAAEIVGSTKTVIFVDSKKLFQDQGINNVISLSFNSQLAGFAAGYDAAVWATTKNREGKFNGAINGQNKISFGVYGGISSKNSVDNYLWGFILAIEYFNMRMQETNQADRHIYFANAGKEKDVKDMGIVDSVDQHYFTGSFEGSGASRSGINEWLMNNGASLIFPVAGPQTAETLSLTNAYVVGVDSDSSESYPQYADRFVTSALKNLSKAVIDAIDHSKANILNKDTIDKNKNWQNEDLWDGTNPKSKIDWSIDVDQATKGNTIGTKIPKTLLDYSHNEDLKEFVNFMVKTYNNPLWTQANHYLNADVITKTAKEIYKLFGNKQLSTEFPSE